MTYSVSEGSKKQSISVGFVERRFTAEELRAPRPRRCERKPLLVELQARPGKFGGLTASDGRFLYSTPDTFPRGRPKRVRITSTWC